MEPAEAGEADNAGGAPRPIQAEGSTVAQEEATVTFVIDGDTVDVAFEDGVVERIRLPQIDTPEVGECGYQKATAVLENLVAGPNVTLVPTAAGDTYGRLVRAVESDEMTSGSSSFGTACPLGPKPCP